MDLVAIHQALLCQWIFNTRDLYLEKSKYEVLDPLLLEDIWIINAATNDLKRIFPDSFWRSVLISWCKYTKFFFPVTYHGLDRRHQFFFDKKNSTCPQMFAASFNVSHFFRCSMP